MACTKQSACKTCDYPKAHLMRDIIAIIQAFTQLQASLKRRIVPGAEMTLEEVIEITSE